MEICVDPDELEGVSRTLTGDAPRLAGIARLLGTPITVPGRLDESIGELLGLGALVAARSEESVASLALGIGRAAARYRDADDVLARGGRT